MASIEIRGIDELQRKLGAAASNKILRDPMQRSVYRILRDMAEYPPQRLSSSYIRTGTLGRRWTQKVAVNRSGVTGKVGNNTEYAPWVQAENFQAWMHKGRWQTDQQVIDERRGDIERDFQQAIDRALEGK